MNAARQRAVVVGAGRAGLAAVEQLRASGFAGDVIVLGAEPCAPYDRTACAKGILSGRQRPRDVALPVAAGLDVDWRFGRRAVALDPASKTLLTDEGDELGYDGLVLATGARPAVPPGWPVGRPGFHVLYTLADAWRLRATLRGASTVAVIGAGLTGCEVASVVRHSGRRCVVVDPADVLLARPLGALAGRMVTDEAARQGVELRLGRRVRQVRPVEHGWRLELDDGSDVVAEAVVASVGERPDCGWLRRAGPIDVSDGILCDERLRVLGAPDVVAAGTAARWPNLQYSSVPARVGQWITAWEHGRAAAVSLLAGAAAPAVTHVPRFWSDQFGLRIHVVGRVPVDGEVRVTRLRPGRRDVARSGVLLSHYGPGGLECVVGVNAPRAFTAMARGLLAGAGSVVRSEPDTLGGDLHRSRLRVAM